MIKAPINKIIVALQTYLPAFHAAVFDRRPDKSAYEPEHLTAGEPTIHHKLGTKISFLVLLLLFAYERSPYIFKFGRFWAEEGSIYFRSAFESDFFDALFFVYPRAGYYHLYANISSLLATAVPLEFAPLVTTYMAALVQFLLFCLILFPNSALFRNDISKYFGCLVVLFSASSVSEVWLNTINSMSYFGLIALVLLFTNYEVSSIGFKQARRVILFIAGLSGPYALILYPFFVFKAYYGKIREDIITAATLTVCLSIQSIIVLLNILSKAVAQSRLDTLSMDKMIAQTIYHNIFIPFFGHEFAGKVFALFGLKIWEVYEKTDLLMTGQIGMLLIVVCLSLWALLRHGNQRALTLFLLLVFVTYSAFTNFVSLKSAIGGRYSVVPGAVIILIVVLVYLSSNRGGIRLAAGILLALSIFFGVDEYRSFQESRQYACLAECPNWPNEVKEWRKNPAYKMHIWPYPRWSMRLTPDIPGRKATEVKKRLFIPGKVYW